MSSARLIAEVTPEAVVNAMVNDGEFCAHILVMLGQCLDDVEWGRVAFEIAAGYEPREEDTAGQDAIRALGQRLTKLTG